MVARIISGRSIRGAINYNEQKVEQHKATFLMAENYLKETYRLNPMEKLFVLQHRAKLNERVKTNCVHISLNFETNEKISAEKMQEIAKDYMQQIGFATQPYLIYKHEDANHPHMHIVTTNIQADGNRISLHNLGRDLSEKARQEIELKYGLIQAKGHGKDQDIPTINLRDLKKAIYGKDETKKVITQIVNTVVQKYNYSSLAELNAVLSRFNILADRGHEKSAMYNQQGLLYRIIDDKGNKLGVPIKASRIAGKHTLTSLEKRFKKNKGKRKILGASLKQRINQVLQTNPNQDVFTKTLMQQKIEVLYRTSKDGQTYGITYIDHAGKSVFNGSELGKAYSAKTLFDGFKKSVELKPLAQPMTHPISSGTTQLKPPQSVKQHTPQSFLEPKAPTNYLDILLGKTEQDYTTTIPGKRKKRKKRNQQTPQQTL
ncbi:relaxase/mobilization nuclease domain-containing protein [Pedobacter nyackensis]|uniref:Relaxase/Mobilisation nuclease domain-containing protein n=1 Tax=Pedobacter nyackensis TaxID=475255 RepID=A0A1W2DW01_9SPHI|nr:relaxase/mobilization nuclease domain-containing protein [Pedobacter nyackensis]SMD01206.1 Relaxase/Mobilisation nuclease domain-containing protein [Pedobacter nyackensis]